MYNNSINELAFRFSPYTYVFEHGGGFGVGTYAIYFFVAAVISIATYFIYKRRPLERASDSTTFKFIEYLIALLIAFFSSSLAGLIFYENDYGYGGYIIGGALGFIVGQMIVRKTMKIFNMESLRAFLIFIGIMVFVLSSFRADLFGYERNVPGSGNVDSVEIQSYTLDFGQYPITFETPENIQSVIDFHQEIVAGKSEYRDYTGNGVNVKLSYALKGGEHLDRQYYLPYSLFLESKDFKHFIESEEADKRIKALENFDLASVQMDFGRSFGIAEGLTLYYSDDMYYNSIKAALLNALAADVEEMTAEELLSNNVPFLWIEVMYRQEVDANGDVVVQLYSSGYETAQPNYTYQNYSFRITKAYERTIEWLNANGYSQYLYGVGEKDFALITSDFGDNTTVDALMQDVSMSEKYNDYYMPQYTPESIALLKKDNFVIDDRELLSDLLKNYAATDTRFIGDETDILRLNVYTWYDYGESSHYEQTGVYYLDKNNLPQEVMADLNTYF